VLSAYFAASQRWWRWLQIDEGDWVITKDLGLGALASAAPTVTPEALEVLETPLGSFTSPKKAPEARKALEEVFPSSSISTTPSLLTLSTSTSKSTSKSTPNPTPLSSSPAVSFDDGEGGGFLFDKNDGQSANGQDTREDEDTIVLDMSAFPRREPVERTLPAKPMTIEVVIPSKRATFPPSSPIVPFDDSEGGRLLFTEIAITSVGNNHARAKGCINPIPADRRRVVLA
jgi:hypothetical protein